MKSLVLLIALFISHSLAAESMKFPFPTTTDYESALESASEADKDLLLLFIATGCGACEEFKAIVLATDTFHEFVNEKLIVVSYDLIGMGPLTEPEEEMFTVLMDRHGVSSTPTFILLDADETVLAKSDRYMGGSAEEAVEVLQSRIEKAETES